MTVLKMKYLPFILIGIVTIVMIHMIFQKKYFNWIKQYWFREPSYKNIVSRILYLTGIIILLVALLDFRGRPTTVESNIPDQKTIIIIDSSSSMLVEDVRPNRFERSLLIARHFIKRSAGHQIAVVVFSDTQKRLIPFTDDLDLLDARVAALEKKNIGQGGSNIYQAIRESIQYFKTDDSTLKEPEGNILLLTDSEDNGSLEAFKLPSKVNLAAVGVGTAKGGRIPMRGPKGRLRGFKRFQGKEVISRLNEDFLKRLGANSNNYRYWVALSYSMPTDEILKFFGNIYESSLKKGTTTIQPVLGHYVVAVGVVFFILATIFNLFSTWKPLALLLFGFMGYLTFQTPNLNAQEKDTYYSEDDVASLEKLRSGNLNYIQKLNLASEFMKKELVQEAITIMEEVKQYKSDLPPQAQLNLGTAYMMSKNYEKGLKLLSALRAESTPDMQKIIDANVNKFLKNMNNEEQEKKDQQKKDQKEQDEKKDQKKDPKDGEGKKNKQDSSGKDGQKKKDEKGEKGKEKDKKKDKNKDKSKDGEKGQDKEQKKKKPQTLKEREDEIRKNRKMVKIPAILKQIMSDDRNLQQKYWKTSTDENNRDKKDW